MSTPVLMPQMGESIAEGTVVRWIKKVGDQVDRDEPLFEISTDKVDAEIPSPAAGVLAEIRVREGETVAVNSVVATIGDSLGALEPINPINPSTSTDQPGQPDRPGATIRSTGTRSSRSSRSGEDARSATFVAAGPPHREGAPRRHRGDSRIGHRRPGHQAGHPRLHRASPAAAPSRRDAGTSRRSRPGEPVEIVPMGVMRKKIAEHMVLSRRTSAHVHSVFEVNFSRVAQLREQKKAAYERDGAKLTFLSFITRAVVGALRAFPDPQLVARRRQRRLQEGHQRRRSPSRSTGASSCRCEERRREEPARASAGPSPIWPRAPAAKQLKPEDVQGGTFTITNPGTFGAQFGMPIINQPQVAILGVGAIEKRAVVIDDAIGIRPMGVPDARLRPSAGGRRRRRSVPVADQGDAGEVRRSSGCE